MNDADLQERMQLAIERISEIKEEDQTIWDTLAKMDAGAKNLKTYFDSVAEFILYVYDVYEIVSQPERSTFHFRNYRRSITIYMQTFCRSIMTQALQTRIMPWKNLVNMANIYACYTQRSVL